MSYTDNHERDAEYMTMIRARQTIRKRMRFAYEKIEREESKDGRMEGNHVVTSGEYTV